MKYSRPHASTTLYDVVNGPVFASDAASRNASFTSGSSSVICHTHPPAFSTLTDSRKIDAAILTPSRGSLSAESLVPLSMTTSNVDDANGRLSASPTTWKQRAPFPWWPRWNRRCWYSNAPREKSTQTPVAPLAARARTSQASRDVPQPISRNENGPEGSNACSVSAMAAWSRSHSKGGAAIAFPAYTSFQ